MQEHQDETLACPECGTENTVRLRTLVDAYSLAKEEILERSLNTFRCRNCGAIVGANPGLVYRDAERAAALYFYAAEDPREMSRVMAELTEAPREHLDGFVLRCLHRYGDLVEKIRMLDAGLDDTIVEVMKGFLFAQHAAEHGLVELSFFERNDTEFVFAAVTSDDREFALRFPGAGEIYETSREQFGGKLAAAFPRGAWHVVDMTSAAQAVTGTP